MLVLIIVTHVANSLSFKKCNMQEGYIFLGGSEIFPQNGTEYFMGYVVDFRDGHIKIEDLSI